MLIKGVDIQYINKSVTDVDDFGDNIYSESYETIHNVLVAPVVSLANSNIPETDNLSRRKEVLTLGIPKGDGHIWEECEIMWNGRRYRSCGIPVQGIEDMIPLEWHLKVTVERCE